MILRLSVIIAGIVSSVFESVSTPVEWVVIPARCSVLATSILQKVYAVGFIWSLRQNLYSRVIPAFPHCSRVRTPVFLSTAKRHANEHSVVSIHDVGSSCDLWRMMKFTGLTKLASPVLHVVLTNRLVVSYRKQRLGWVYWGLHTSSTLNVERMVVLARRAVFAPSSPQIITAIFFLLTFARNNPTSFFRGRRSLRVW